jgi:ketosteroid isomerase-like protein
MKLSAVAQLVVALLLAGAVPAIASNLPPDLARAVRDYDRATVAGDTPALERLFADDYVLVNSDASVENKQQAIADFRMPGFKIDPYVLTQPVETAWDTGAVIGGVVNLSWTQDGKHQQRWIRIAHVWARRGGAWQMTYTQVTRLPQPS